MEEKMDFVITSLISGKRYSTGGLEARDHESVEWTLDVYYADGQFYYESITSQGDYKVDSGDVYDKNKFMIYLKNDPSLLDDMYRRFKA